MKTNLDKLYKTDSGLEKNGVWFEISDEIKFLVKPFRASNPSAKAAMAQYYKPHARQIEMDTLDPEKAKEISVRIFLKACLVDWQGVEIDGAVTPYSSEVALPFFMALPDLFDTLWKHCNDFQNYREDLGNS